MAVVRDNNKWNADLLTDLTSLGSDDGVTSDVVAWAVDQNNWYYPTSILAGSSTWTAQITDTDLQTAYEAGNTIVTDSTNGDLDVSGTEAISLDAGAASNFSVDSASLTLETTTSGNWIATSAGQISMQAAGSLSIFTQTNTGSPVTLSAAGSNSSTGGSMTISSGGGALSNAGGALSVTSGDGGPTGTGGTLTVQSGDGGSTSGNGGALDILAGSGVTGASTQGGAITMTGGAGNTGGNVTVTSGAGDNGSSGILRLLGGDSTGIGAGGQIIMESGDSGGTADAPGISILTGDPTDGDGGDIDITASNGVGTDRDGGGVSMNAGDATGTGTGGNFTGTSGNSAAADGDAGDIFLVAGNGFDAAGEIFLTAGSSSGGGHGRVNVQLLATGVAPGGTPTDNDQLMRWTNSGTNGGTSDIYVTDQTPIGNITANPGSLAVREDTTNSNLYIHTGASANNTDWTSLGGGGGASAWSAVLAVGAVSGGTNPILTDGDEFQGADGSAANGGTMAIRGGDVTSGAGDGGAVDVDGGDAGGSGVGGTVTITGGAGGATAGNGGNVSLQPGPTTAGSAGSIIIDYATWPAADGSSGQVLSTNGSGTLSWVTGGGGGVSDLQEAYEGGNTIVTDTTNGDFDISGTEAISLDASSASNFTVAGANLTLSTTTSGDVVASAAANVDIDGAGVQVDSTGAFSIDGGDNSNVSVTSADLTLSTITTGDLTLTPADDLILDYATWPAADGTNGQVLTTDGAGALSWEDGGSGGGSWDSETNSTTGASATNTIATPVSALADGEQTSVEVQIFGVDNADATNTYYRRQVITYYRDGGSTTTWTIIDDGKDERRGTFPTTLTAGLTTSSNDVIVNADTTGLSGGQQVNWTVLYLTRDTITAGGSGSTSTTTDGANIVNVGGAVTGMSSSETWFRLIDSDGSTTAPTETNIFFHYNAAYDGRVLRASLFTDNDPGSTTFRVYKDFEGTASISATATSSTALGTGFRTEVEFAAADLFTQGELLTFSVDTTNNPNDASMNFVLALTGLGDVLGDQVPWVVSTMTSSFTAEVNTKYKYDASSFSGTISMPASPSNGDEVIFKNVSTSVSGVTLSGNGNNVESPSSYSLASSVTLAGDGNSFTYSFDGTQWLLI